jgi:hypothetical protein
MNKKIGNRQLPGLLLVVCLMTLVGVSAGFNASAQKQMPPGCPTTKVQCPDSVRKGEKLKFTAEVKGGDSQVTPTYNWAVSAGQIESGQGTSTIEVSTKEVDENSTVTATVDLGGFDRECGYGSIAASCTSIVDKK